MHSHGSASEDSPPVTRSDTLLFGAGLAVGLITLAGVVTSLIAWLDAGLFRPVPSVADSQKTLLPWLATGAILAVRLLTFRHSRLSVFTFLWALAAAVHAVVWYVTGSGGRHAVFPGTLVAVVAVLVYLINAGAQQQPN